MDFSATLCVITLVCGIYMVSVESYVSHLLMKVRLVQLNLWMRCSQNPVDIAVQVDQLSE